MKLERIQEIYNELEKYVVQLHSDPRSLGPQYLSDLIATTRNHLNAVSRVQLEVHREKQYLSREIRAHEAAYQVSADDLLANDERVRRLPSIEDRKATVAVFLRAERLVIDNFKSLLQDVEFVDKAVRHRHKELTSTMSEIKLQRSLIRDEIDTGAMYGDERTYSTGSGKNYVHNPVEEVSEAELEAILNGGTIQKDAPPVEPTQSKVTEPVTPQPVTPQPVISQPVGVSQEIPTEEEVQISDFLGGSQSSGSNDIDLEKIMADF